MDDFLHGEEESTHLGPEGFNWMNDLQSYSPLESQGLTLHPFNPFAFAFAFLCLLTISHTQLRYPTSTIPFLLLLLLLLLLRRLAIGTTPPASIRPSFKPLNVLPTSASIASIVPRVNLTRTNQRESNPDPEVFRGVRVH